MEDISPLTSHSSAHYKRSINWQFSDVPAFIVRFFFPLDYLFKDVYIANIDFLCLFRAEDGCFATQYNKDVSAWGWGQAGLLAVYYRRLEFTLLWHNLLCGMVSLVQTPCGNWGLGNWQKDVMILQFLMLLWVLNCPLSPALESVTSASVHDTGAG